MYFPKETWIISKLEDLYDLRVKVAHNSYLDQHEQNTLTTIIDAIYRQLEVNFVIDNKSKLNHVSEELSSRHYDAIILDSIQELFKLFSKSNIENHLAKNIASQILKIGNERLLEVLNFYLQESEASHHIGWQRVFEDLVSDGTDETPESEKYLIITDELFVVTIRYKKKANRVRITHKKKRFDYSKPEKNSEVRETFLKSFRERCEKKGIKL